MGGIPSPQFAKFFPPKFVDWSGPAEALWPVSRHGYAPGGCAVTKTRSPALQSPCVCGWIDAHTQTDVSPVHLVLHFLPGEGEVLRRRTLPNKRRAAPSMILSVLFNVEGFPSLCVLNTLCKYWCPRLPFKPLCGQAGDTQVVINSNR